MAMSTAEVQALYAKHLIGNYTRAPIAFVRGEGCYLWDADGKRYLDLIAGIGVDGLGHCAPRVVAAVQRQAGTLMHIHNNYMWEPQALLGQKLCEKVTGMKDPRAFLCNSGTEASEAAIKLARLYGKQHGGKWKLIAVSNGFHGRTYAALSATGQPGLQKGCEPLLTGFSFVPLNDIGALKAAFDAETIGFMVEPVQGEGGIFIATPEYLRAARELCDKHGALLMYDEVQCGMGRTGSYFAYQTIGAPAPDVIWLAKLLGGGFPIGAMVAAASVAQAMVPGTHGTTYGGNPTACAASLAVFETIDSDKLLDKVQATARYLAQALEGLRAKHKSQIKEIRQMGLMAGIDLNFPGKAIFQRCLELGLIINVTHDTTLRMLPALNVSPAQLEEGLKIISQALSESK
jgi:acetylornithine/N-succinyldiaminopimelate aminotransferase